jgi:hypothetical protein
MVICLVQRLAGSIIPFAQDEHKWRQIASRLQVGHATDMAAIAIGICFLPVTGKIANARLLLALPINDLYHLIVDFFLLSVIWDTVGRVRRQMLKDESIRSIGIKVGAVVFLIWLFTWIFVAFYFRRWQIVDVPLWFLENFLRVLDFADVMESFDLHLHTIPREGINGVLTFACRMWIALALTILIGRRKLAQRRLATPPDAEALPFWSKQIGLVCGLLLYVFTLGLLISFVASDATPTLAAAVGESERDSRAALNAIRRMGVHAQDAIPTLVAARAKVLTVLAGENMWREEARKHPTALKLLLFYVQRHEPLAQHIAVRQLGKFGKEATPALPKRTSNAHSRSSANSHFPRW